MRLHQPSRPALKERVHVTEGVPEQVILRQAVEIRRCQLEANVARRCPIQTHVMRRGTCVRPATMAVAAVASTFEVAPDAVEEILGLGSADVVRAGLASFGMYSVVNSLMPSRMGTRTSNFV